MPGADRVGPLVAPAARQSWAFASGARIAPTLTAARSLGGGALFEVYLAWDERRLCHVACKLARPDKIADASALRQLRRESNLLARLAHPVIVRSLGAMLEGARPHLLLEYHDKFTLRRRIRKRGPMPVEQWLPLALHLGSALHYLSSEGVVHLDVKPGNVLVGSPPRLIDLSVARSLEWAKQLRQPVGSAAYMAPEQCVPGERGEIGAAADVWGLGVTLYEAITGQLPFPKEGEKDPPGPGARYPQLAGIATPLPAQFPPELANLVMQCLNPEPSARPAAGDLVAALRRIASSPLIGQMIKPPPAPPVTA